jgi:hypothetical protein
MAPSQLMHVSSQTMVPIEPGGSIGVISPWGEPNKAVLHVVPVKEDPRNCPFQVDVIRQRALVWTCACARGIQRRERAAGVADKAVEDTARVLSWMGRPACSWTEGEIGGLGLPVHRLTAVT